MDIRVDINSGSGRITNEKFDTVGEAMDWIRKWYGEPTKVRHASAFMQGFTHEHGVETTVVFEDLYREFHDARV